MSFTDIAHDSHLKHDDGPSSLFIPWPQPSEADTSGCDPVKTRRTTPYRPWQDIVADKKSEQRSRIPKEWHLQIDVGANAQEDTATDLRPLAWTSGLLTDRELEITSSAHDATALLAKIAGGTYTSVDVVTAFCKRAAIAHQVANCLTEIMFADAMAAAEKLDEEYARLGGKTVGPLHGLPMTFKVCNQYIFLLNLCCHAGGICCLSSYGENASLCMYRNASMSKATMLRMDTSLARSTLRQPTLFSSSSSRMPGR